MSTGLGLTLKKARPRITPEEFVRRARDIHGTKYEYAFPPGWTFNTRVIITCPIHGEFRQASNNHLYDRSQCPACANAVRGRRLQLDLAEFVKRARQVHGDRFDYSETVPVSLRKKVKIRCREHGIFETNAANHLNGSLGCVPCGRASYRARRRKSQAQFLQEVQEAYRDKPHWDASGAVYGGKEAKVEVICLHHGPFLVRAAEALKGGGCPGCKAVAAADFMQKLQRAGLARQKTTEEFIASAQAVHGTRYDYSRTVYTRTRGKVTINCPLPGHGEFESTAMSHLAGCGCPRCGIESYKLTLETFIERANKLHANKYDYSQIKKLDGLRDYVAIVCPTHGPFRQRASHHLDGAQCKACAHDNDRISQTEFVQKIEERYQGRYDVSRVQFSNVHSEMTVRCTLHDLDFITTANRLFIGKEGCPFCQLRGKYSIKQALNWLRETANLLETETPGVDLKDRQLPGSWPLTLYVATQIPRYTAPEGSSKPSEPQAKNVRDWRQDSLDKAHEEPFLNLGIARRGYAYRYLSTHPYRTEGTPDRVTLPAAVIVLLEQVLLKETSRFKYTPKQPFQGGANECRSMCALPQIEQLLAKYLKNPAELLESRWVREKRTQLRRSSGEDMRLGYSLTTLLSPWLLNGLIY